MRGRSLSELVDGLAAEFAGAARPERIDACPCGNCGWRETVEVLLRTPRELLGPRELAGYAASVLNTVGSARDLRYFTPRILPLALDGELVHPGLELVCVKLAQAGWREWPEAAYLRELFDALWADVLDGDAEWWDAEAVLCALAAAEQSVEARLAAWARLGSPVAVERLHEFATGGLRMSGEGLLVPVNGFWDKGSPAHREVVGWLNGDGPQDAAAAVESAIGRTGDAALLELLFAVHDVLTPHRATG